jgi:hypothetical protein
MVLSATEIGRGVQGALAFLQRDPAAPLRFENTMEACLRSFRVMAVAAPFHAIYRLIGYANVQVTADALDILIVEAMRYVVDWLLFPVIFYEVARRRGWLERYPRYIGALNWISLPATLIAIGAVIIESVAPLAVAAIVDIMIKALFFYWFLVTTRIALNTDWLTSVVLLVVSWVPSIFLSIIVARYVGLLPPAGGA